MLKLPAKRFCSFPSSQQLDLKSSSERPLACWGGSTANKLQVQGCGSYCTGMWGVEKGNSKKLERCQKFSNLKCLTLQVRSASWRLICNFSSLYQVVKFCSSFVSSSPSKRLATRMGVTWGTLFNWGVSGGGLGGCVGGWSSRLAAPPNPGHPTKRLPRCPSAHQQIHHLIGQFVINSRLAFDAFKANGCLRCRHFWSAATCTAAQVQKCTDPMLTSGCISPRIQRVNFYTQILSQPHIYSWLWSRCHSIACLLNESHFEFNKKNGAPKKGGRPLLSIFPAFKECF